MTLTKRLGLGALLVVAMALFTSTPVPASCAGDGNIAGVAGTGVHAGQVASPREPLATQGANAIIEDEILAENQFSAVPLTN